MRLKETGEVQRILDFDIENRPLSYWYGDKCTADITAIAWQFLDEDNGEVYALGEYEQDEILERFVEAFNKADMVTGHYIRRHDLPIINAALVENGMRPLSSKKTHDTKLDLVRCGEQPQTQEYLSAILGIEAPKVGMSQTDWREANRLTPEGIALTKQRVVSDVQQHILLRYALIENRMLKPPSMWNSVPGGVYLVEVE